MSANSTSGRILEVATRVAKLVDQVELEHEVGNVEIGVMADGSGRMLGRVYCFDFEGNEVTYRVIAPATVDAPSWARGSREWITEYESAATDRRWVAVEVAA